VLRIAAILSRWAVAGYPRISWEEFTELGVWRWE
jgi:hypothetical protein